LKPLVRFLKTTVRRTLGLKRDDSVSEIMKSRFKWVTPKELYFYQCMCMIKNIASNNIPYFRNWYHLANTSHSTRNRDKIRSDLVPRNRISERSLDFHPLRVWNQISDKFGNCSEKMFKELLKKMMYESDVSMLIN
jgi:hypothetical protein